MKSIVFFDLDDTLAVSKQPIEDVTAEALSQLLSVTKVGIATGGAIPQIKKQVIDRLPVNSKLENLYCFCQNAASCYSYKGDTLTQLYSFDLSEVEAVQITSALEKVIEETGVVKNEESYGPRIENRGAQVSFSALGQQAPPEKKKNWDPDQKKRLMLRELLAPKLLAFDIGIGGGTTLDITRKGINKTYAMKWTTENLNISISDMLYVGDALFPGGNDYVVVSTGIQTVQTSGPSETVAIIKTIITDYNQ